MIGRLEADLGLRDGRRRSVRTTREMIDLSSWHMEHLLSTSNPSSIFAFMRKPEYRGDQ